MSIRYTLTYDGTEKTFADWKLTQPRRKLISQGISTVTFRSNGEDYDADAQFPQGSTMTINKIVRDDDSGNETSTVWFVGRVEQPERFGNPSAEGISYLLVDAIFYLAETIYKIAWKERSIAGDPDSPLVDKYLSEIFLNKSITDTVLTTRQQIADALQYCLTVMALPVNGSLVPFQFDSAEFTAMNVPVDKVVDAPCLQVIIKQLRFMPDAVMWVDYATEPPTIHIKRRAALTPVSINVAGKPTEEINIRPRYDLQRPSVELNFRIINNNNGTPLRETVTQIAPEGATGQEFRCAVATINLEGFSVSVGTNATISRTNISPDLVAWWKTKQAWLADARIQNLSIGSVQRETNYSYELLSGTIPADAAVNSVREKIRATATFDIVQGEGEDAITLWKNVVMPIEQEVHATDATVDSFSSGNSGSVNEPIPADMAEKFYEGVSFVPWEGKLTFAERELTSPISIGNVLNLTGGHDEWETMNAVVQQVEEDMETGKTTVTFGPPAHLGIPDLVELLRFNSQRFVWGSNAQRASGASGGSGTVLLPKGTPVSNAANGWPSIKAMTLVNDSVTESRIKLDTDLCLGHELKPQEFTVCINNVTKKIMLLASAPYDA